MSNFLDNRIENDTDFKLKGEWCPPGILQRGTGSPTYHPPPPPPTTPLEYGQLYYN